MPSHRARWPAASTRGDSAGGHHLGIEDHAARALSLVHVGSGDNVVSQPVSPGLHAAWPVPALPCSPSCPQGTWGYPVQPPKTAILGEKGRRKTPGPHFSHSHQPGSARGTARDSPLAPGGHRSPNTRRVHRLRDTPWHRVLWSTGPQAPTPLNPPTAAAPRHREPWASSGPLWARCPGTATALSLARRDRPWQLWSGRPALAESLLPGPASARHFAPGSVEIGLPQPHQPPGPTHQARALPGLKCYLSLRAFAISLFRNYYF